MPIFNHSFKVNILIFYLNHLDNTEKKILTAATTVFRKRGFSATRMEELAKEADVNKALLNYYYRSKEKLFQKVFQAAIREFFKKVMKLLGSDLPLDMKVYKAVDLYTRMLLENPDLPIFIMSEIREFPSQFTDTFMLSRKPLKKLEQQLQEAYSQNFIRKTSVYTFLMNLLGLTVFPFIAEPLAKNLFQLDRDSFEKEILARKKILPGMIIQTLKP